MSEPEMANSAPLPKVLTTVLAKGTTSAAATRCDSASSQVGAAVGALHRGGRLHAGVVVGVGDAREVGAARGHAGSREEGHELVRAADVERDPRDIPVAGAEQRLLGRRAGLSPCPRR